ncbi:MAG: hypothetical protein PWR01_3702 [Clostridiales bacterium]|jgi:hypothetical protein|nr:hypothetical protein [Clostridiales bacterium]MDN5282629.1 hypothetical protein [Candidatus Ozemobacter sp.]
MNTENNNIYSPKILCAQLHALYDMLEARKKEIVSDPSFSPGNFVLNNELELIYQKTRLLQECFEKFCSS